MFFFFFLLFYFLLGKNIKKILRYFSIYGINQVIHGGSSARKLSLEYSIENSSDQGMDFWFNNCQKKIHFLPKNLLIEHINFDVN